MTFYYLLIIILQSDCADFSGSWCFVNSIIVTLWTFPPTMIDYIVFYTISAIFQPYNGSSPNKFGIGSRYYIIFCYFDRSILFLLSLTYTSIFFSPLELTLDWSTLFTVRPLNLSLIHIWRCRRYAVCRSRWSPYH